jgi:hypothetical protein
MDKQLGGFFKVWFTLLGVDTIHRAGIDTLHIFGTGIHNYVSHGNLLILGFMMLLLLQRLKKSELIAHGYSEQRTSQDQQRSPFFLPIEF